MSDKLEGQSAKELYPFRPPVFEFDEDGSAELVLLETKVLIPEKTFVFVETEYPTWPDLGVFGYFYPELEKYKGEIGLFQQKADAMDRHEYGAIARLIEVRKLSKLSVDSVDLSLKIADRAKGYSGNEGAYVDISSLTLDGTVVAEGVVHAFDSDTVLRVRTRAPYQEHDQRNTHVSRRRFEESADEEYLVDLRGGSVVAVRVKSPLSEEETRLRVMALIASCDDDGQALRAAEAKKIFDSGRPTEVVVHDQGAVEQRKRQQKDDDDWTARNAIHTPLS